MTAKEKRPKNGLKNTKKNDSLPHVKLLKVKLHSLKLSKALSLLEQWIDSNKQHQISTPNPEQLFLAQENKEFLQVLNNSDLNIVDGAGLVWAAKRLNLGLLERIAGVDLMFSLCSLAADKGWRVFLLGGKDNVAQKAAAKLKDKYPNIKIAYFAGSSNIANEIKVEREGSIERINKFGTDLLFVAYGAPYQELWIANNLPSLKVGVAMSVGGAIDYIAGSVKRAPEWIRKLGLEWLFRLIRQPWRIKRQFKLIRFVWLVLKERK